MSLDQLETFLQESDEKDYLPSVNDQEEYQKFLAAVLEEGTAAENKKSKQDPEEDDDDDDGDFEAEIEEALWSDHEEKNVVRPRHRIETRERRRERSQSQKKERLLCVCTGQLRPLIPYVGGLSVPNSLESGSTGDTENGPLQVTRKTFPVSGFTAHQIGQLHSLIHEHVQLLIQVFALCILEPTRQQIAIDTHRMLIEFAEKRDAILSWKDTAFPDFCFRLPYIHPSVNEELLFNGSHGVIVGRVQGNPENAQHDNAADCHSAAQWAPSTSGPVRSLLDVAPLSKVREFLANMGTVVQLYRQRHVETGSYHSECEREPLFGSSKAAPAQANSGLENHDASVVHSPAPHGKKSLAAALVESTKKQCIALVPKEVVEAIQMFFPLFNPALFPHKAPPPATSNRLLFTDSEDELLAMGLMTYNTDWKAIQQRFLPSKTMHQIFVRQKNRSSARAPENSIKAVRRLKLSALTPTERESICKYCVPYRDPAILPRQWRIAQGTQKSYKLNGSSRERHRLYEANRRRTKSYNKIACLTPERFTGSTGPTRYSSCLADDERSPVQDAFFADWRPCSLRAIAAAAPLPNSKEHVRSRLRKRKMKAQTTCRPLQTKASGIFRQSPEISSVPSLPFYPSARLQELQPNAQQPGHPHGKRAIRTVKLSPDLPSLNLPPHVLVLSKSQIDGPGSFISSKCLSDEGSGIFSLYQNQPSLLQTLAEPLLGQKDRYRSEPHSNTCTARGSRRQGGTSSPQSFFKTNRSFVPKNPVTSRNNQAPAPDIGAPYLNPHVVSSCHSLTTSLMHADMYHPKITQINLPDMAPDMRSEVPAMARLPAVSSEQTLPPQLPLQLVAPKFHPFFCDPGSASAGSSTIRLQASCYSSDAISARLLGFEDQAQGS